jgi:hypothetical protein
LSAYSRLTQAYQKHCSQNKGVPPATVEISDVELQDIIAQMQKNGMELNTASGKLFGMQIVKADKGIAVK